MLARLPSFKQIVVFVLFFSCFAPAQSFGTERKFIVITDMEPDDRVAVMLLAANFRPSQFLLFGATLKHAGLKAALLKKLLGQMGFGMVPVYQGQGGTPEYYPDFASNAAGVSFKDEGREILSAAERDKLLKGDHSSMELKSALRKTLQTTEERVEIVLLAPPADLVQVLLEHPELNTQIKQIHVMGGWSNGYTTYNWNMEPKQSWEFVNLEAIPVVLYSSHMIKPSFSGGSINSTTFPIVIETLLKFKNAGVDVFEDFFFAAKYWDQHVIATIPPLAERLSPFAGRQFTPADPIVIVGLTDRRFIEEVKPIRVTFDLDSPVERRGYKVEIGSNQKYNESNPWWEDGQLGFVSVEKVNSEFFGKFVATSFEKLGSRLLKLNSQE